MDVAIPEEIKVEQIPASFTKTENLSSIKVILFVVLSLKGSQEFGKETMRWKLEGK